MKSDWEGDLANMELEGHQHTAEQCLSDIGHNRKISINCEDNETVLNIANEMSVTAARSESRKKCMKFASILQFFIRYYVILCIGLWRVS